MVAEAAGVAVDLGMGGHSHPEAGKSRVHEPAVILFSAKQLSIRVVEFLQAFRRVRAQV